MTNNTIEVSDRAIRTEWPDVLLTNHLIFSVVIDLEPLAYLNVLILLLFDKISKLDFSKFYSLVVKSFVTFNRIVLFKVDVVRNAQNLFHIELFLIHDSALSLYRWNGYIICW